MRQNLTLILSLSTLAVVACGTRGGLTLPPPQSTSAPASIGAPAPSPATDVNTRAPQ